MFQALGPLAADEATDATDATATEVAPPAPPSAVENIEVAVEESQVRRVVPYPIFRNLHLFIIFPVWYNPGLPRKYCGGLPSAPGAAYFVVRCCCNNAY